MGDSLRRAIHCGVRYGMLVNTRTIENCKMRIEKCKAMSGQFAFFSFQFNFFNTPNFVARTQFQLFCSVKPSKKQWSGSFWLILIVKDYVRAIVIRFSSAWSPRRLVRQERTFCN